MLPYNSHTHINKNNHNVIYNNVTQDQVFIHERCSGYFAVPFMQCALAICVKLMSDLLRQQLL